MLVHEVSTVSNVVSSGIFPREDVPRGNPASISLPLVERCHEN